MAIEQRQHALVTVFVLFLSIELPSGDFGRQNISYMINHRRRKCTSPRRGWKRNSS
jgi:hypothetical protein